MLRQAQAWVAKQLQQGRWAQLDIADITTGVEEVELTGSFG